MSKTTKSLFHSGFWTTVLFIVLQLTGVTSFSWWWIIVTLFFSPIAWIAGIVWLLMTIL